MSARWDPRKDRLNARKHGITFREAVTVYDDPMRLILEDREHSGLEERWIILGTSVMGNMLRVTCTFRGDTMRPISARRATKRERHEYRHGSR